MGKGAPLERPFSCAAASPRALRLSRTAMRPYSISVSSDIVPHLARGVRGVSMTLLLWKGPVVHHPDEAKVLLQPYYNHGDDSAFQPSPDLGIVCDELLR